MRILTLTLAAAALIAPLAAANALPPVRAGILQCQGGQNVGFVVGSVTSLECVFQSEGRRPEPYIATVRRYGLDLGITAKTQLAWAVNAPNSRISRGDLAGNYGGFGANASVGVGGGGNFLVGGLRTRTRCSRSACRARPGSMLPPGSPISSCSRSAATVRAGTITAIDAAENDNVHIKGPRKRAFFFRCAGRRRKCGTALNVMA